MNSKSSIVQCLAHRRCGVALFLFALSALGCAQTFSPLYSPAFTNAIGAHSTNRDSADLKGGIANDTYKLRVGDRVSLQIMEDREPPRSLLVADSGELEVPCLGRITAADQTCTQLAAELKRRLEQDYYHHATVVLGLEAANKYFGRIYIWGQVRNQGPIDLALNENLTVAKAILRAGGFAEFANKKKVKLIRNMAEAQSGKRVIELNLSAILEEGLIEQDVVLRPDDLVIVPSRLINF